MKKCSFLFVAILFGSVATLPLLNLVLWNHAIWVSKETIEFNLPELRRTILNRDKLFNIDFIRKMVTKSLYNFGVSIRPQQAIIGYDGWIFLGDYYSKTRTVTRRGLSSKDTEIGIGISKAAIAWERYLNSKGVKLYRVMIAPNKGTIYSELLPKWANPAKPSALEALKNSISETIYIDLRPPLLKAKKVHEKNLYYRTDTHWNDLGAMEGFKYFLEKIRSSDSSIRLLSDEHLRLLRIGIRKGGDLAKMVDLQNELLDIEPIIEIKVGNQIRTNHYDLKTNAFLKSDENKMIEMEKDWVPMRVFSEGALNNKKVFWVRDSFGDALCPFMSATFTETVQLYWKEAFKDGGSQLIDIVDSWKPDYVFVTIIERDALSPLLTTPPLLNSMKYVDKSEIIFPRN